MQPSYYADIGAIDISCIDQWQESLDLKVSHREFDEVTKKIIDLWVERSHELGYADQRVFLSDGFPFWFNQIMHAAMIKSRLGAGQKKLLFSALSSGFFEPDWTQIGSHYQKTWRSRRCNFRLRSFLKNLRHRQALSFPRQRNNKNCRALGIGSNDDLKKKFSEENALVVNHTYPQLIAKAPPPDIEHSKNFKCFVNAFLEGLFSSVLLDYLGEIPFQKTVIVEALCQRHAFLTWVYRQTLKRKPKMNEKLLVTEAGKSIHKVISCAWSDAGGSSIGFHHGHHRGETLLKDRTSFEFFAYDAFVCPNGVTAKAYADQSRAEDPDHSFCKCVFVTSKNENGTSFYTCVEKKTLVKFNPQKKKSVMLMGFPMTSQVYYGHLGCFWATQLDLHLRVIRRLVAEKYEVYYKVHPERVSPTDQIVEKLGAKVLYGNIEESKFSPDITLITYSSTSSLPTVLRSGSPVIFINCHHQDWDKHYLEALKKRCFVFNAELKNEGQIAFDEKLLSEVLSRNEFEHWDSYINAFYCEPFSE